MTSATNKAHQFTSGHRHLHWFRNELRLAGNLALASHAAVDSLLCVYLIPNPRPWCNLTGLGGQRDRFLRESLQALKDELQAFGQDLMVLEGAPELVLPDLVRQFHITEVSTHFAPGYYERKTIEHLERHLSVPLKVHRGNSLLDIDTLPFALEALPATFTPFRKQVEAAHTDRKFAPVAMLSQLPPPPAGQFDAIPKAAASANPALAIRGGRAAGLSRLRQFTFDQQDIVQYKTTRNGLDGFSGSSTLSPWLANGGLSVREVAHTISTFEREQTKNESTYWLYFELLWREFFYWRAVADDYKLFQLGGKSGNGKHCTFEPRAFARWCAGDTSYPLVNALMRQLTATGWMSNRGRQITASCLIRELGIDWRFGAAFFEKHLIDYDVGSNYGNWQYIAGVGSDPRGGRHFNLEKQTREHDPDGLFIAKWGGIRPSQPEFATDAADWPIG